MKDLRAARPERMIEQQWLNSLVELSLAHSNLQIFDLKALIENHGRDIFYDQKLWYLGGIRYSLRANELMEQTVHSQLRAIQNQRKKCLVIDLDNTLWGGIVGDDGIDNLVLGNEKEGAVYKDFQKRIKEIKELGVVLALVSKNNPEDALNAIRNHPHMVLKEDDFVRMKINWSPKSANIEEIAAELNIGLDAMVFIDDNPAEREQVQCELPDLIIPDFPRDISQLPEFIQQVYQNYFLSKAQTEEDRQKTLMYQQNFQRMELLKTAPSLDKYLAALGTRIALWKMKPADLERVHQLIQKTNQFNLTTRRYTAQQLQEMAADAACAVYVVSAKDKFGDNGVIAAVIVKRNAADSVEVDSFVMSCRVMSRGIEDHVVTYLENKFRQGGARFMLGHYMQTAKNRPVADLYERLGYELIDGDEKHKIYRRDLSRAIERRVFSELVEL